MATKTSFSLGFSSSLNLFCSPLTTEQLIDVLDLLKRCGFPQTKWYGLGLKLGLHKNTLDAIERNHPGDVSRCLTGCLSKWLSRADNVESKGGATFDSLSDALKSMNENAAADKLDQEKMKGGHVDPNLEQQPSVSKGPLQPVDVTEQSHTPQPTITGSQSFTPPTVIELSSKGEVATNIGSLHSCFASLDSNIRDEFEELVVKGKVKLKAVARSAAAYLSIDASSLKYGDVDELFDSLQPHYDFFSYDVLKHLTYTYLSNALQTELTKYIDSVDKFLESSQLKHIRSAIKEKLSSLPAAASPTNTLDIIKLTDRWEEMTISKLKTVLKHYFGVTSDLFSHISLNYGGGALGDRELENQTLQPEVIEKWLSEGSVELTVTRVNMHGPPGAGKTCAQDLLLNNPPTAYITDSTPIARPAVKATRVSVDNEAMKWEKVNRDGLLERLASDLKEAAASQPKEKIFPSQYEEIIFKNSYPVSTDNQQTTEPHDKSTVKRVDSATETDESIVVSQESFSIGEGVIQEIVGTIQSSEVQLNLSGHWLYIIDSGGQPAYQELLPLFVRTASLNIITLNLSQPLDKKLDFQYRIGGETFSCGLNFKYSNRDFFLSAVSSGAILKPINVPHVLETPSHPMNFVLGTHYDLITEDKLKDMNKELMSSLKPDVENYVVPNVRGESIIFPVNTLVPEDKGRMKAGQDLCQSIANCGGTSLKINVPIRWFAFELWLQKIAEDKSRSFLIIDEVISAGKRFKMNKDDTKDALQYLHNVTIILYYPDILPQLVFVDPKPILEVLSRLLALTYVERKALHLIANPVPSEKYISKLHNVGFFKEKLLMNHFTSLFSPPHFQPSHLLKLLIHLRIIASGEDGDYFIPCALESYTEPPELQTEIKPLLIVWLDNDGINTLPVPQGMFPLVITHLLSYNECPGKVDFPPLDPDQYYRYRDALSFWIFIKRKRYTLHVINRYSDIAVYFDESVQEAKAKCPDICKLVMKAVSDSADTINVEHNHVTAFSCPKRSTCYCVVEEDHSINCTLCKRSADIAGDSYWCWFGIVDCGPTMITSVGAYSGYSQLLDVCDLDDILTDLKDGRYYSSNWKELGLKLGLYDNTLNTISVSSSDIEDRLRECIVKWLLKVDGVDDKGGANWTTLVRALEQCDSGKPTAEYIRCKRLINKSC